MFTKKTLSKCYGFRVITAGWAACELDINLLTKIIWFQRSWGQNLFLSWLARKLLHLTHYMLLLTFSKLTEIYSSVHLQILTTASMYDKHKEPVTFTY